MNGVATNDVPYLRLALIERARYVMKVTFAGIVAKKKRKSNSARRRQCDKPTRQLLCPPVKRICVYSGGNDSKSLPSVLR